MVWKPIWRNNSPKLPNLRKEINIQIQNDQKTPIKIKPKRPTLRNILKLSKITASENLKKQWKKSKISCKIIIEFLSGNLANQKGMGWYIQNAKRKKPQPIKNIISSIPYVKTSWHWIWQWFLGYDTKSTSNKSENRWNCMKLENFCMQRTQNEKAAHRMEENNYKPYIWKEINIQICFKKKPYNSANFKNLTI